jgi:inhibitor of cysteine peptidase
MSKIFTKKDKLIKTKIGEIFTIELESNPTTGYQWQESFDETKVKLLEKKTNLTSKLIGAATTEVFTFQPIAEGNAKIKLDYKRSWESEKLESLEIKVETETT